jgi:hypothetical protein
VDKDNNNIVYSKSQTFKVVNSGAENKKFYLGEFENTHNGGKNTGTYAVNDIGFADQENKVVYSWSKFENYTNGTDSYANYEVVGSDEVWKVWTRESSSDNESVISNKTNSQLTVCFNPSYYRLYMYVSDKQIKSEASSAIPDSYKDSEGNETYTATISKKYTSKDDADKDASTVTDAIGNRYNTSGDHGVKGGVNYNSDYLVCRTTKVVNSSGTTTSVADMIFGESEVDAPVEYYNLNGVKMNSENLAPGLYIMRRGDKAAKVLIR